MAHGKLLSKRDSIIFAEALLNPPAPSDNLRAAVADYFVFIGEEASEEIRRDLSKRKEKQMAEQQGEKNPVVEQVMATVEAEFGERLDEAGREKVRTGIERNRANAAALAAYGLANGDEPGTVFRAYRGE